MYKLILRKLDVYVSICYTLLVYNDNLDIEINCNIIIYFIWYLKLFFSDEIGEINYKYSISKQNVFYCCYFENIE